MGKEWLLRRVKVAWDKITTLLTCTIPTFPHHWCSNMPASLSRHCFFPGILIDNMRISLGFLYNRSRIAEIRQYTMSGPRVRVSFSLMVHSSLCVISASLWKHSPPTPAEVTIQPYQNILALFSIRDFAVINVAEDPDFGFGLLKSIHHLKPIRTSKLSLEHY